MDRICGVPKPVLEEGRQQLGSFCSVFSLTRGVNSATGGQTSTAILCPAHTAWPCSTGQHSVPTRAVPLTVHLTKNPLLRTTGLRAPHLHSVSPLRAKNSAPTILPLHPVPSRAHRGASGYVSDHLAHTRGKSCLISKFKKPNCSSSFYHREKGLWIWKSKWKKNHSIIYKEEEICLTSNISTHLYYLWKKKKSTKHKNEWKRVPKYWAPYFYTKSMWFNLKKWFLSGPLISLA